MNEKYNRMRELLNGERTFARTQERFNNETERQIYLLRKILIDQIEKELAADPQLDPEQLRIEKQRWARKTYGLKLFRLYLPKHLLPIKRTETPKLEDNQKIEMQKVENPLGKFVKK